MAGGSASEEEGVLPGRGLGGRRHLPWAGGRKGQEETQIRSPEGNCTTKGGNTEPSQEGPKTLSVGKSGRRSHGASRTKKGRMRPGKSVCYRPELLAVDQKRAHHVKRGQSES